MAVPENQVYISGLGQVDGDALNTFVQCAASVAGLRGFVGVSGMSVYLLGTTTPADGGQGNFYWNAGALTPVDDNGATTIVPYSAGQGCWTREPVISVNASPVISAALGNGTTDASAAINAAIASLGSGGGDVVFPAGNFLVNSSAVILPSNVTLVGSGRGATVITGGPLLAGDVVQTLGFAGLTGRNLPIGPYKFGLRHLSINGNKSARSGSGNGVSFYGYDFTIDDVEIYNCLTNCWYSEWCTSNTVPVAQNGDSMEAHVTGLKTFGAGQDGIQWFGPHDSQLSGIVTFLNGRHGLNISNTATYFGGAALISNFNCYANSSDGVLCNANIIVNNFESGNNTGDGITLTDTDFSNLVGSNITVTANGGAGFNHTAGYIDISAVTASANTGNGISVAAAGVVTGLFSFSNGADGLRISANVVVAHGLRLEDNGNFGLGIATGVANLNISGMSNGNAVSQLDFGGSAIAPPSIIDMTTFNTAGGQTSYSGTTPTDIYLRIATAGSGAASSITQSQT